MIQFNDNGLDENFRSFLLQNFYFVNSLEDLAPTKIRRIEGLEPPGRTVDHALA